jgi:hypothetical protein
MTISADDTLTSKRIKLIIKFLNGCTDQYNNNHYLSSERHVISILNLFMHQSYATIIFILNEIDFSSQCELLKISNLSILREVDNRLRTLESLNIVGRVNKKDDDYCIIKPYWRIEHPTSPYMPNLYKISPQFKDIIKTFAEEMSDRYIWKSTFVATMKRKARYESFYKNEAEKIFDHKNAEAAKLGNCIECNKIIREGSEKGEDFQKPKAGYVCPYCWEHASDETKIKWMQSKQ